MRSFVTALALGGLAVANPLLRRQEIDWDQVDANPVPTFSEAVGVTAQTVVYATSSIIADATSVTSVTVEATDVAQTTTADSLEKRGNCAAQPTGATGAPTYSPDNVSAFAAQTAFGNVASAAPTPSGYSQTFTNLAGSNNAYGYLGFTTLQTYDTATCAAKCNKINGCMAINIYFERDPSLDPGTNCPNPSSYTMIKCVFWGGPVDSSNAVNVGQWRNQFQVAIAGSNGYVNNSIATPKGYKQAVYLGAGAINAPYDSQGYNSYMGSNMFPPGPFNAQLCADFCNAQNVYNLAHPPTDGKPVQTCQFFNTYLLYINSTAKVQGQNCAIYSESWAPSYATNIGQYRGNDHWMIEYSYSFSNATNPGAPSKQGAVYQARDDINWVGNNAAPYCSSILGYTVPITTTTTTVTATPTADAFTKRDATSVPLPDVLTKYPATVVTSACSIASAVSSPTSTSTVVVTTTVSS